MYKKTVMKHLLIENKGELDISSLILLGASTKRDSNNMIGFFGSGNKYAIATLIKHGIKFAIYSGEEKIEISTEDIDFRGVKFKKIIIGGRETSLTTDMGPQWQPWMAIREWVSNSIDEGGYNLIYETETVQGREGHTRFYVEHHPLIDDIISNWNSYFSFEREDSLYTEKQGKIFPQTDPDNNVILYRKGIRCWFDKGAKSLFEYDCVDFEINESRLVDSLFNAEYKVAKMLNRCTSIQVASTILEKAFVDNTWESRLPWRWGIGGILSATWRQAIDNRCIIVDNVAGYFIEIQQSKPCYIVSVEMAMAIRNAFSDVKIYGLDDSGSAIGYKTVDPSTKQKFILDEATKFCEECQYQIGYPIEVVEFEDKEVLGRAYQGTILLSTKIFDMGRKQVVVTLIEENEHLKTGFKDCSRAFQNHLFNLFLTEKEERFGFFL
jgi:hypothetical protein